MSTAITLTSPIDSFSTTVEMPFVFDPDGSGTIAFDTLFFALGSVSVPCPAGATCSSTGGVANLLPSVFVNGPFAETEITWGELGLPGPFLISVGDTISFQYLVPEPRLALLLGAPVVLAAGRRRRALS